MRTVEILKNSKWIVSDFKDIKTGDILRMFEEDGEPVLIEKEDGNTYFKCKAISDAFVNESDGVLSVLLEESIE